VKLTGFSNKPDPYEVLNKLYSLKPGKLHGVYADGSTHLATGTQTAYPQSKSPTNSGPFVMGDG
jgi:hypothetical protein